MSLNIKNIKTLTHVHQGLEREVVRVDSSGAAATTSHPTALGSPLTHPHITLDFAEAQLEFTTPPLTSIGAILSSLTKTEAWASCQLKNEYLWSMSMPPILPEHNKIPLANFGTSDQAEKKHLYREGLKQRYGGAMQTISGIHYNFSMDDSFWVAYAAEKKSRVTLDRFKDAEYFGLMRNVIRLAPLVTYLYGASPLAHASYFADTPLELDALDSETYVGRYATSLRLSKFGYHNLRRNNIMVSYNSLDEYLNDLFAAISTPSKMWSTLGVYKRKQQIQLNANILQLENEFYTAVRAKQKKHNHPSESSLCSLACAGVEYVELRIVDIDPFAPSGITRDQLFFLQTFMLYCLLTPSARFKDGEQKKYEDNQRAAALYGRKPGLQIFTSQNKMGDFKTWMKKTLRGMTEAAAMLDRAYHTESFSKIVADQFKKIENPDLTPSARLISAVEKTPGSYIGYGLTLAAAHEETRRASKLAPSYDAAMHRVARESKEAQAKQEAHDAWILKDFEHMELSTQVLIRAAQKRNITVDIIDEVLNVIALTKGDKQEIVKQATVTRLDTYLSYELMTHKYLTKLFLGQAKLRTPHGGYFKTKDDALAYYAQCRKTSVVVKPTTANYGVGVSIVNKQQEKEYRVAVERAFQHAATVLIEEFIPGKEYRFLVIDKKVVGVLNREPANVTGDGVHTIQALVKIKNEDPKSFKLPDKYIRLGTVEREILKEVGLTIRSVPAKGRKVYLRKNSNVSDGGDPIDVTDSIPVSFKKMALRAAAAVGANICGIDMLISDLKKGPIHENYAIIELNWNPAIFMHAYPVVGKPRDVGGAMLDFLGF